jgi:hypothetical protein
VSSGQPARNTRAGRPDSNWYGLQPWWQIPLEAAARREHGHHLRLRLNRDQIAYRVPMEVRGRRDPVPLTIEFHAHPPYDSFGLPPEEYPRVFAVPGVTSPHRMPDDGGLCLWFPHDPPERRWCPRDGLLALIDLARDHVFYEDHWRATGGRRGGEWLGDERPHGFPRTAG